MTKYFFLNFFPLFLILSCSAEPNFLQERIFKNSSLQHELEKLNCQEGNLKTWPAEWCILNITTKEQIPFSFPKSSKAYLGLVLPFSTNDTDIFRQLKVEPEYSGVGLVVLGSNHARLMDVSPSSEEEKIELEGIARQIKAILKGESKNQKIEVSKNFYDFLQTRIAREGYAAELNGKVGEIKGGAGINGTTFYLVDSKISGKVLIASEGVFPGAYLNIYPWVDIKIKQE